MSLSVEEALKELYEELTRLPEHIRRVHFVRTVEGTLGLIDWLTAFPKQPARVIVTTLSLHLFVKDIKEHTTQGEENHDVAVRLERLTDRLAIATRNEHD